MPVPEVRRLDGGLTLLHLEQHALPLVNASLTLKVGSADDPPDAPGLAFATASLVDEGAGSRSAVEIAAEMQEIGGALAVTVDSETTTLSFEVLRPYFERALGILADVVLRPHLAAAELDRVKGELTQRALARRADAAEAAYLALAASVFGRHPYARPALPRVDEIRALRRAGLRRFFHEGYRPDRALLVVAGDITSNELWRAAGRAFGRWRGAAARRPRVPAPPARGPRLVLVEREGASESALCVGNVAPPRHALAPLELRLLNMILGGSFTSRLNRNLRETHGFTYGVSSSFALGRTSSLFSVAAEVESAVTEPALREIDRELAGIVRRPVGPRELGKARALVAAQIPEIAETLHGLTDAYTQIAVHREPLSLLAEVPARLQSIGAPRLLRTARRVLRPERATVVVVGACSSFQAALERRYGPAERRDADGLLLGG